MELLLASSLVVLVTSLGLYLLALNRHLTHDPSAEMPEYEAPSLAEIKSTDWRSIDMTEFIPRSTGRNYLIVGTGQVGTAIIKMLYQRGERHVRSLDMAPANPAIVQLGLDHLQLDMTDQGAVSVALHKPFSNGRKAETVLHTAALIRFWERRSFTLSRSLRVNRDGTRHVAQAFAELARAAPETAHVFVYCSSAILHLRSKRFFRLGFQSKHVLQPPFRIDERSPTGYYKTAYTISKLAGESAARDIESAVRVGVLRPGMAIIGGSDLSYSAVIRGEVDLFCGGKFVQSFVHPMDVAAAHLCFEAALVRKPIAPGQTLLITGDRRVLSNRDVYKILGHYMDNLAVKETPLLPVYILAHVIETICALNYWLTRTPAPSWLPMSLQYVQPATTTSLTSNIAIIDDQARELIGYKPAWSNYATLQWLAQTLPSKARDQDAVRATYRSDLSGARTYPVNRSPDSHAIVEHVAAPARSRSGHQNVCDQIPTYQPPTPEEIKAADWRKIDMLDAIPRDATGRNYIVFGAGQVGAEICALLVKRGEVNVRSCDLMPPSDYISELGIDHVQVDVRSREAVKGILNLPFSNGRKVETIFHTAALIRFWQRHRYTLEESMAVNGNGTHNIAQEFANIASKCPEASHVLIYCSSAIAYLRPRHFFRLGQQKDALQAPFIVRDGSPVGSWKTAYSLSKQAGEHAIERVEGSMPNLLTGHLRPGMAIVGLADLAYAPVLRGDTKFICGADYAQSFITPFDCAAAHICFEDALLEERTGSGQKLLITGDRRVMSNRDVFAVLAQFRSFKTTEIPLLPILLLSQLIEVMCELNYSLTGRARPDWLPFWVEQLQPSSVGSLAINISIIDSEARRAIGYMPRFSNVDALQWLSETLRAHS
ncbi:uncharacterized protein L969DRAFT_92804 [Mixia osmundae IAM 14324]|uniref:3-beta hydroxysteroid dehydrogenase/isomerase domain-containing protein n=1 Tax=Mixia osmundae (strain CBS 9802 / IAM 14324 / JCM 22182 / KY 12970) TaxID=764103 RepID=G7DYL8_MIXOS|nr:uncharacterized protein L969DRAFT_92804 [Mixia osmundae IAM 14324]KEI41577.1 hypothetical protein L969DRAFT_92804 [Mixia osmundae IAM 14324]GAA95678.1 hypothetical protein E5Q_02335 [Mixia osmundae IAM 14324]